MEEGNTTLMAAVMLGWSVVVPVVFLRLGKRAGALTAVVGGNLIMPWVTLRVVPGIPVWFAPQEAIALALVTGMLAKEGMAVFRGRPRWFDLPILVYAAYPLVGLVTGGPAVGWDVADMTLHRVTGWLIPYAAARRYLGDVEGARRIAVAIVVTTLAYVPVCAWEAVMGPRWYLGGLIYGHHYGATMVERLGGWRPEGFFMSGIFLASWVAIVSAVAFWLWLGRSWRPSRGPAWWPSLVLVATSIGCRGVYGYIDLFCGLTAALLAIRLKARWVLVGLAIVAPLYVASRVSGVWGRPRPGPARRGDG